MTHERQVSAEQVGNAFRALVDEHASLRVGNDARNAWRRVELANPIASGPRFGFRAGAAGVALALALCAAAGAAFFLRSRSALSYTLHGVQAEHGVLATHEHGGEADFSDQSRLVAEPDTAFNVDVTGRHAARARLMKGALHVAVHHADDTNWSFLAGPYEVRVIGTEFDLSWDPAPGRLAVTMKKGAVVVLAPDGSVRALKAGETFNVPALDAPAAATAVSANALTPAAAAAPTSQPAAADASNPPASRASALSARSAATPATAVASDWDALVAKGAFAEVVRQAESAGVEQALAARGATDLKALAQAARYSGHADLSLRAWTALRERFARSAFAQQSSFFLGRIYEDQGNPSAALKWLTTYSTEAPGGVYAAEALGRRLSLLERLRGKAGAAQQAREYLDRFPGGAYAPTARAILNER